jgi:hypothetical protein
MDKREILDEIKRTAMANGGKPLGKDRFYRETGIKQSDWLGKYWVRWGDALRESGFEPNRLQGPHDEHDLIEKFIPLMRELGKFPTHNEIVPKARTTEGFPWHKTFAKFGSKQQLAARIQEYCKRREGYDDILALCNPLTESRPTSGGTQTEPEQEFGFVYLIKSGRHY